MDACLSKGEKVKNTNYELHDQPQQQPKGMSPGCEDFVVNGPKTDMC